MCDMAQPCDHTSHRTPWPHTPKTPVVPLEWAPPSFTMQCLGPGAQVDQAPNLAMMLITPVNVKGLKTFFTVNAV